SGYSLLEQFESLGAEGSHGRHPSDIASGAREACDEPGPHRVAKWKHDDWDRASCVLRGLGSWSRGDNDDVRLESQAVGGEGGKSLALTICGEVVDREGVPIDVTQGMRGWKEGVKWDGGGRGG